MSQRPHLLLVEDEPAIRTPLVRYLERDGYRVTACGDAAAAREALAGFAFHAAILDIMLPGEDGLSLARSIREGSDLPILFLSARAEDVDRIIGLEMGADDYLTKPFNPRELTARLKAILRRSHHEPATEKPRDTCYRFAGFTLDPDRQALSRGDEPIALTGGDYALLLAMVERAGRPLSREQLLDLTKGREADPFDRAVDNAVMRLRRKLGAQGAEIIRTVHGTGYSFAARVEKD
ncbi:response regulator [Sphingomicrobium aestuariivivum]|uniref:response regulator n=1 Tax=Sphingomicrobium aestuariivivum TaxID=1582356 RepID=UPI001FD6B288|nr:response regulator transcription factor [Sphingomicrobium aestuariivivum]MCJ8191570.1 response regulator transcription factor [Sphingomicrobium aestuariivivum]